MNGDSKPPKQWALFRYTSLCLSLLGSICLCVAGGMMVRWSLKYAGVGKFTIMGGLAIVVSLALAARQLKNVFRARPELNHTSDGIRQPASGLPKPSR